MSEWHESDAFWEDTAPFVFDQARLKSASEEAEQVLKLLGLPDGAAILDLGCGVGRHSLEFARRGMRVTGVDRTEGYLERARAESAEQGLDVEWVRADMREFRRENVFDAAVSLLTSFSYFADPAEDRRVAENVLASLKPGGRFVIDLMGKEVLARIFREKDWHEEPDGTLLLEERRVTQEWGQLQARWIIIRDGARNEHRFTLRLYSAAELSRLLRDAGFSTVTAYGSLAGAPYDEKAERLVLVACKGEAA